MGWLATLHGDVSGLDPEHAAQAEAKVRDALAAVAGGLADDGHVGIGATFHGTRTGDVNLLAPGDTPDGAPVGGPEGGAAVTAGTQPPGSGGELGGSPEVPEGVTELTPGMSRAPTLPAGTHDPETGQELPQPPSTDGDA